MSDRAVQFQPFDTLKGYYDMIRECEEFADFEKCETRDIINSQESDFNEESC